MSNPDSTPQPEPGPTPAKFHLKPSRNQKRRSKLQQVPDESAPAPAPPPETAPKPTPPPAAPLLRVNRLKRSGHIQEDWIKPSDEKPAKPETEY